jgi:hypothetical protein
VNARTGGDPALRALIIGLIWSSSSFGSPVEPLFWLIHPYLRDLNQPMKNVVWLQTGSGSPGSARGHGEPPALFAEGPIGLAALPSGYNKCALVTVEFRMASVLYTYA